MRRSPLVPLAVLVPLLLASAPTAGHHLGAVTATCSAAPGSTLVFDPPLGAIPQSGSVEIYRASGLCGASFVYPACGPGTPPCASADVGWGDGELMQTWDYEGDCVHAVLTMDPPFEEWDEFDIFGGVLGQFRRIDPDFMHEQIMAFVMVPDEPCNVSTATIVASSYVATRD